MKNLNAPLAGLLQALGIIAYCALISGFFWAMNEYFAKPDQLLAIALMLILLVFSAAVTGLLFFGYPAYLVVRQRKIRKALVVIGFTMAYCLVAVIIIIVFLSLR